jgi:hypothetical protein
MLAVGLFGGIALYQTGHNQGYESGYKKGHDDGYSSAPQYGYDFVQEGIAYDGLATKYNTLVSDYNNLRSAAINYVSASQFQARQPITCNTYSTLSGSATTNCY